jgi:dynein heavy chain 1
LDDNKSLTLPNGERLNVPHNVRVLFEVEHLNYATPATVSRCGMVWFSDDILDVESMYRNYMTSLEQVELFTDDSLGDVADSSRPGILETQKVVAQFTKRYIDSQGLLAKALTAAPRLSHIMPFDAARSLSTLFASLSQDVREIYHYDREHPDFPLPAERIEAYLSKQVLLDLIWAFAGDADQGSRTKFGLSLAQASGTELPIITSSSDSLLNYAVDVSTGSWQPWSDRVPTMEVDVQSITATDVVIPTVDTLRHEALVYSWIKARKPVILCGPPGSGKTMTLFNALRKLPDIEVAGLNFSSATTPDLILRTFEQYCEYKKTSRGIVLSPASATSWLMVFCDEVNLPAPDAYGTQRVISFIRQMVEAKGFWRSSDLTWIHLERVQFIGACNPPTDPGRTELGSRFLRHAPVLYVDYPEVVSLTQIYGTYTKALLKLAPNLRGYAQSLTQAMVDFYQASKRRFSSELQAHYIYSPRELTRWIRGIYETLRALEDVEVEGLVRIWAHEALRLFQDRLVDQDEKAWTDSKLDEVAMIHFPTIDRHKALSRPILFSNWTTQHYQSIDREILREYTKARLRTFYEEEMDVQLVLFDDVLDHVLRIDRVFRQSQGHMLLIGVSGGGKVSAKQTDTFRTSPLITLDSTLLIRPPFPGSSLG